MARTRRFAALRPWRASVMAITSFASRPQWTGATMGSLRGGWVTWRRCSGGGGGEGLGAGVQEGVVALQRGGVEKVDLGVVQVLGDDGGVVLSEDLDVVGVLEVVAVGGGLDALVGGWVVAVVGGVGGVGGEGLDEEEELAAGKGCVFDAFEGAAGGKGGGVGGWGGGGGGGGGGGAGGEEGGGVGGGEGGAAARAGALVAD